MNLWKKLFSGRSGKEVPTLPGEQDQLRNRAVKEPALNTALALPTPGEHCRELAFTQAEFGYLSRACSQKTCTNAYGNTP